MAFLAALESQPLRGKLNSRSIYIDWPKAAPSRPGKPHRPEVARRSGVEKRTPYFDQEAPNHALV